MYYLEGYHHKLNRELPCSKPNVYLLMNILYNDSQTETNKISVSQGKGAIKEKISHRKEQTDQTSSDVVGVTEQGDNNFRSPFWLIWQDILALILVSILIYHINPYSIVISEVDALRDQTSLPCILHILNTGVFWGLIDGCKLIVSMCCCCW